MLTPVDLIYPPRCILCQSLLSKHKSLCGNCEKNAPFFRKQKTKLRFLDSYTAVWYYKGYVRDSLLRYKFSTWDFLDRPYGRLLAEKIRQDFPQGIDVLTWVPTAGKRRRKRGYDQCKLLAKAVGRELGIRPRKILRKIKNNPAQSGISDAATRRANAAGAYQVIRPELVKGRRVLVIDDILTTGATVGECAKMLKFAGAGKVFCAVMAASPKL